MSQRNIAFLVYDYSVQGGVERVVSILSKEFLSKGYDVKLLLTIAKKNQTPLLDFPHELDIEVLENNSDKPSFDLRLRELLIQYDIGHLIYQGDNMSLALKIQKAITDINCVGILHYHGSPYAYLKKAFYWIDFKANPIYIFKMLWSQIQFPFKKKKLAQVLKAADYFVTVSEGVKRELEDLYPDIKNNEKLRAIRNLMTFEVEHLQAQKFNLRPKLISYVSRLERKHKNSMRAVRVWQHVFTELPDWRFQIIGDGGLKTKMENFISRNDIDRCDFLGFSPNVEEHLRQSRITILTSDFEGLAMVLLEASANSNALISTKSKGGVIDIIPNRDYGFLVSPNDPKEMAQAIIKLADNNQLLEQKVTNNQNHIQSTFNKTNIMRQWSEILSES